MCARTTVTTLGEPSLIAKNAGRAVRLFGTELLTVWIDLDGLTSRTLAAAIRQTGSVLSWTQSPDGIVDVKGAFSPAYAVCSLETKVNELNRDLSSTELAPEFFDSFPEAVAYKRDNSQSDPDWSVHVYETMIGHHN